MALKPKTKNLIFVAIAILIPVVLGGIGYSFLSRRPSSQVTAPPPGVKLPSPPATPSITSLPPSSNDWPISPAVSPEGTRIRYFNKLSGTLKAYVPATGESLVLSPSKFESVIAVYWAPSSSKAILEYESGEGSRFSFFDFDKNQSKPLDSRIKSVAWSPDAKKIAYHLVDERADINSLIQANPDGSSPKTLLALSLRSIKLYWPSSNTIFILEKPAQGIPNGLFSYNLRANSLALVDNSHIGLSVLPSPNGRTLLVSYAAGPSVVLEITDIALRDIVPQPSFVTLAEKCAWAQDGETFYCAVPKTLPAGEYPFAFYSGETETSDNFFKFNIKSTSQARLELNQAIDASDLVIPKAEDYIFFINRVANSPFSIKSAGFQPLK